MASIFAGSGIVSCYETWWPRKNRDVTSNTHFSRWMRPSSFTCRQTVRMSSLSGVSLLLGINISSSRQKANVTSCKTVSIRHWKVWVAFLILNGMQKKFATAKWCDNSSFLDFIWVIGDLVITTDEIYLWENSLTIQVRCKILHICGIGYRSGVV